MHAVLEKVMDAVNARLAAQRALQSLGAFFRVRMGLHTGEAELRESDV